VDLGVAGETIVAGLIDFSYGRARIKTDGMVPVKAGDTVDFNINLFRHGLESGAVPCTVVWVSDSEIEVRFSRAPRLTVGELQALLDD